MSERRPGPWFCHEHQMWPNEFGWCDRCGEPETTIRPPLTIANSPRTVTFDFSMDDDGTPVLEKKEARYTRHCSDWAHVYEKVPGDCQCGERWWDGKDGVSDSGGLV